jgi:hypothetical protein
MESRKPYMDCDCAELGGDVRLKRLSAADGMTLGKRYNAIAKDADGSPTSDEDMAGFFAYLLSLSIIDESGEAFLCSDEGRSQLSSLSLGTLSGLGTEAMIFNGMAERKGDTKKKDGGTSMTPPTHSLSTSAEN